MDKLRSRTMWLVLLMLACVFYLADKHDWAEVYVLSGLVILISCWFGGKMWASFLVTLEKLIEAWGKK